MRPSCIGWFIEFHGLNCSGRRCFWLRGVIKSVMMLMLVLGIIIRVVHRKSQIDIILYFALNNILISSIYCYPCYLLPCQSCEKAARPNICVSPPFFAAVPHLAKYCILHALGFRFIFGFAFGFCFCFLVFVFGFGFGFSLV